MAKESIYHPLYNNPMNGTWCLVKQNDVPIFEGYYEACWRLVHNKQNSFRTPPFAEFSITPTKYERSFND